MECGHSEMRKIKNESNKTVNKSIFHEKNQVGRAIRDIKKRDGILFTTLVFLIWYWPVKMAPLVLLVD